ncbi:MAG: formylmethanofuran dehydrogenase subunit A [Phycisphaeraceae bacterium]
MSAIRIINGRVIDPVNDAGLDGIVREVLVHEGRVAGALPAGVTPRVIDAAGCVVMAGGIDMHAHIASTGINLARAIGSRLLPPLPSEGEGWGEGEGLPQRQQAAFTLPERHANHPHLASPSEGRGTGEAKAASRPSQSKMVPGTLDTGRRYAQMGYTTVIEAAVGPSDARHAHLQLDDTPLLDTGILVLMDNHELLIELLERGDDQGAAALVQHLLNATAAYGVKAVNPAGVASWRRDPASHDVASIDDPVPGTKVTPRKIIAAMTRIVDDLGLAHPLHMHGNRLGLPGNAEVLLETVEAIDGRRMHIAHLQFYGYGKTEAGGYTSAAPLLAEYLRQHPKVTADVGMVMFGPAFTVTADTPLEHGLWRRHHGSTRPAVFIEAEGEAGIGVMPTSWSRTNRIHSLQWAIGLELLLRMDPWQVSLTIDHPNGGSFTRFPEIIALLMSQARRDEALAGVHAYAREQSGLGSLDRELSLRQIAIVTRAAPARALGLKNKGHLGAGADADVTIYRDACDDPAAMFARPAWVIKAGEVVVQDGEMVVDAVPGGLAGVARRLTCGVGPNARGAALLSEWMKEVDSYDPRQLITLLKDRS